MSQAACCKWLYLDLNSYFASVEQQLNPALRGRPVAVVPVLSESTVAISASYEAKAFNVATGTRIAEAIRQCPDLQLVPARHDVYVDFHHRILAAIERCLHVTQVCSIDEVACQLLGRERELENALALARRIKHGIVTEIGACLRCSIGLAPTRFLAKVATEIEKPDGLVAIEPDRLPDRLLGLALRDLPGIGPRMERRLNAAGIHDVAGLWSLLPKRMRLVWGGVTGERFWCALHGIDLPELEAQRRSIGHSRVLAPGLREPETARRVARRLVLKAGSRLRRLEFLAGALDLGLDIEGGGSWSAEFRCRPCQDSFTLLAGFESLWRQAIAACGRARIKKVSVTLHRLVNAAAVTPDLFASLSEAGELARRARLSAAMDALNRRFGRDTVTLGIPPEAAGLDYMGTKVAFTRIPEQAEFQE
jgi:DNA polymerase-4